MIVSRIFLTAVGITYLYLACWCSLMPVQTSQLVGFDLKPGSGQSERTAHRIIEDKQVQENRCIFQSNHDEDERRETRIPWNEWYDDRLVESLS